MTDNYDWNALAAQAESGQLVPVKGTALRGEAAARSDRTALLTATGVDSIEEAKYIALGRPRLASESDESVTWKVRALGVVLRHAGAESTRAAVDELVSQVPQVSLDDGGDL